MESFRPLRRTREPLSLRRSAPEPKWDSEVGRIGVVARGVAQAAEPRRGAKCKAQPPAPEQPPVRDEGPAPPAPPRGQRAGQTSSRRRLRRRRRRAASVAGPLSVVLATHRRGGDSGRGRRGRGRRGRRVRPGTQERGARERLGEGQRGKRSGDRGS